MQILFNNFKRNFGKGNLNFGKGNMLLHSHFKELNQDFYNLNLQNSEAQNNLKSTYVDIKKDGYNIESNIYHGKNFCIINTKRLNTKQLTEFVNIKGEYILIAYLLSGNISISYKESDRLKLEYGKLEFRHGNEIKNTVVVPANKKTESILIYISRPYFVELLEKESWSQGNDLYNKIIKNLVNHLENSFIADYNIHTILTNIISYYNQGNTQSHYLELKIRELFLTLEDKGKKKVSDKILHLKKIQQAKDYIDKHYRETPTIKELSRIILLNEMQLKNDFKKVYGITIRAYIIELKMKKAIILLKEHPVEEVTHMLGYRSVSHFITIYKNYHGTTPSKG